MQNAECRISCPFSTLNIQLSALNLFLVRSHTSSQPKKSEMIEGIYCQTRTDARSKCRGKFICTMPCKKEENKVKPSAQHTKAYVSNSAIDVLVRNSPIRMIFYLRGLRINLNSLFSYGIWYSSRGRRPQELTQPTPI